MLFWIVPATPSSLLQLLTHTEPNPSLPLHTSILDITMTMCRCAFGVKGVRFSGVVLVKQQLCRYLPVKLLNFVLHGYHPK